MVAKSYQNLEQVGEPYTLNHKKYIKVRTKSGILKQVRFYSEAEYLKMYPEDKKKRIKTEKEVLGFTNGYITIFKGNTYEDKEYFQMNHARYSCLWGWYFVSTDELPDDIPEDVEPVRLDWELVGNEDETLKPQNIITEAVDALIYDNDISEYQGSIGERLTLTLTVEKAISLESAYGISTLHTMRDYDGNCYVWTTTAKHWKEGTEHCLAGTVKEHKTYKGVKQTILTRCRSLDE